MRLQYLHYYQQVAAKRYRREPKMATRNGYKNGYEIRFPRKNPVKTDTVVIVGDPRASAPRSHHARRGPQSRRTRQLYFLRGVFVLFTVPFATFGVRHASSEYGVIFRIIAQPSEPDLQRHTSEKCARSAVSSNGTCKWHKFERLLSYSPRVNGRLGGRYGFCGIIVFNLKTADHDGSTNRRDPKPVSRRNIGVIGQCTGTDKNICVFETVNGFLIPFPKNIPLFKMYAEHSSLKTDVRSTIYT